MATATDMAKRRLKEIISALLVTEKECNIEFVIPPHIPFSMDAHLTDDVTPKQFGERKLSKKRFNRKCKK